MNLTANDLLKGNVTTQDGSYPVKDLFYMPEGWSLRYALVDTGGWFRSDEVLVSVNRLSRDEGGTWKLNMGKDELESAPMIDTLEPGLVDLPPLVVGPFGYTFSPLAMAASVANVTQTPGTPSDAEKDMTRDGSGRIMSLERISALIGREAYGDSGALGKIADLEMDEDMVLTHAILDDGQRIGLVRVRRIADQGHVLFN